MITHAAAHVSAESRSLYSYSSADGDERVLTSRLEEMRFVTNLYTSISSNPFVQAEKTYSVSAAVPAPQHRIPGVR